MRLAPVVLIVFAACFAPGLAKAQVCTLALDAGGTLGLSGDGTILGSEEGLGLGGTITIVSIGSNTVSIAAPSRVSGAPVGYDASGELVEVAYQGLGGLAVISQPYTSAGSSFVVGTIALSLLGLNNRIINPKGFAPGVYVTRTVVTCS